MEVVTDNDESKPVEGGPTVTASSLQSTSPTEPETGDAVQSGKSQPPPPQPPPNTTQQQFPPPQPPPNTTQQQFPPPPGITPNYYGAYGRGGAPGRYPPPYGYPQQYYPPHRQYPPPAHHRPSGGFHNNLASFYAHGPPQSYTPPQQQPNYHMYQQPMPPQQIIYHQTIIQPTPPQPPPIEKPPVTFMPPDPSKVPAKKTNRDWGDLEREAKKRKMEPAPSHPRPNHELVKQADIYIKQALKNTKPVDDLQQVYKFFAALNVLIADAKKAGKKLTLMSKIAKWLGSRLCLLQDLEDLKFEREKKKLLVTVYGLQFCIDDLPKFEEYRALLPKAKWEGPGVYHIATDLFVLSTAKLDRTALEERLRPIIAELRKQK